MLAMSFLEAYSELVDSKDFGLVVYLLVNVSYSYICSDGKLQLSHTHTHTHTTAVQCAMLKTPTHGSVTLTNDNLFNSVATYACDYGFEMIGDSARFCQSSGIWTGRPPGCYGNLKDALI